MICVLRRVSRWENAPGLREAARPMRVMVALYCASYAPHLPPALSDVVHGHQQLSLFNAHYDERCFLCQGGVALRQELALRPREASRQSP
jgi:hypothetical protein